MNPVELLNAWGSSWFGFMTRALIDASVLLALILVVWLPMRRRVSACGPEIATGSGATASPGLAPTSPVVGRTTRAGGRARTTAPGAGAAGRADLSDGHHDHPIGTGTINFRSTRQNSPCASWAETRCRMGNHTTRIIARSTEASIKARVMKPSHDAPQALSNSTGLMAPPLHLRRPDVHRGSHATGPGRPASGGFS